MSTPPAGAHPHGHTGNTGQETQQSRQVGRGGGRQAGTGRLVCPPWQYCPLRWLPSVDVTVLPGVADSVLVKGSVACSGWCGAALSRGTVLVPPTLVEGN